MIIEKSGILYEVSRDDIRKLDIDKDSYQEIDDSYCKDKNGIYFYYNKYLADKRTFFKLHEEKYSKIYVDKKHIFIDGKKIRHNFNEYKKIKVVDCRICHKILEYNKQLYIIKDNMISEISSYRNLGDYFFINGVLYYKRYDEDNAEGSFDMETFEFVHYFVQRDKNGIYYDFKPLKSIEFPDSYEYIKDSYSRDEKNVYYSYKKIDADVKTFVVHEYYAEDKDFLYKNGVKII